jgi:hypothetical protein
LTFLSTFSDQDQFLIFWNNPSCSITLATAVPVLHLK